jgi:hypothetical protein
VQEGTPCSFLWRKMKTLRFNIFLLSLSLVILMSSYACTLLIPEEPKIFTGDPEKEFLGVPWGIVLKNYK